MNYLVSALVLSHTFVDCLSYVDEIFNIGGCKGKIKHYKIWKCHDEGSSFQNLLFITARSTIFQNLAEDMRKKQPYIFVFFFL